MRKVVYSVVVPIFEEEGNIAQLDREIRTVMDAHKLTPYEIIYVNDGSRDKSVLELRKLKKATIINLQRNYGQSIALDAGFKAAQGEYIVSMDGDLQNDANDIPRLLEKLHARRLDVVAGWRRNRKDKSGIKILTRTGRLLRRLLIKDPVHDTGCTLRVYRAEAAKSLDLWGEMHRYILALLRWKGFSIGELEVNHRPRVHGRTKYGYNKAFKGFVDLLYIWFINKYSNRPLHMFGLLGLGSFVLGALAEAWALFGRLYFHLSLNRNGWFFLGFFFIIMGVQFFVSGIMLDLMIRTYFNSSTFEKRYLIRSTEYTGTSANTK